MQENPYIIEGGEEGKKRLNVLSEVLYPYTKGLIESCCGDLTGKSFLDVGTGGGNVALMAAGMVGKTGNVTAIDFDEKIVELAHRDAQAQGADNITYRVLNAYDLDYENAFDVVYSRFLLSHLQRPGAVLEKMLKALKPGGRLIVEDIDFSGHFCHPENAAFEAYVRYFETAARNNGQNLYIGLPLFEFFKKAGVDNAQVGLIQPFFSDGKGKWMAYYTMDRIKETVIKQNLTSRREIENILQELKDFTNSTDSIISLPRVFRCWGRRAV